MYYSEAMQFLETTYKFGSKLGLMRIESLLRHMGDPQKKLKFVHVAGTNGKGSTTNFIANILIEAGYKVGVYTSPYIHSFNERIKCNELEISNDDVGRIMGVIKEKVELMKENDEGCPTEFEVVTALAFQYYLDCGCDIVVLEVGLGGRLDSTNIIDNSEVSVITTIDYDHMSILGGTLHEIALEKAGIIKDNGTVVLYPQEGGLREVFIDCCKQKNAKLIEVDKLSVKITSYDKACQVFNYKNYADLQITLLSEFQCMNASTAISAVEVLQQKGYKISTENIYSGLYKTTWPGRFEILMAAPVFIVDGAHNVQGAKHLYLNLKRYFDKKKITFIIGILEDKNYKEIIECVLPIAKCFIVTKPPNPRALSAKKLAEYINTVHTDVLTVKDPAAAAALSLELCEHDEVICSFGSLYYLGAIRDKVRICAQQQ